MGQEYGDIKSKISLVARHEELMQCADDKRFEATNRYLGRTFRLITNPVKGDRDDYRTKKISSCTFRAMMMNLFDVTSVLHYYVLYAGLQAL